MTDRPQAELDEAVSAVVDDEASDDDVVRVAEDEHGPARLDLFRRISGAHLALARSEVARSAGTDERISAALAAGGPADPASVGDGRTDTLGIPVIGARTSEHARRRPVMAVLAGVAAAVILIVAGLTLMRDNPGDSTASGDRTASSPAAAGKSGSTIPGAASPEESADKSHGVAPEGARAPAAPTTPVSTTTSPSAQAAEAPPPAGAGSPESWGRLPSLGDFPDRSQLVAALGLRSRDMVPFDPQSIRCTPTIPPTSATTAARASLAGVPVVVIVTGGDVTVVDPSTCRILTY